ncbi:MAG: hypothetical protein DRG78_08610 [Epsilonproteobacteria bacterium]|nr:MAG: hypothetical protein DRG78_08610 [Campylobacterota bacterium]
MKSNKLKYSSKIEMLKYNISRYDSDYLGVNFKSSFLVIGNITILGFLISYFTKINMQFFYISLFITTCSLFFTLLAIKPYLKSNSNKNSLIFFNDVANVKYDILCNKLNNLSKEQYINDLIEQMYVLSKGLQIKFKYLNISTTLFMINCVLLFIYVLFILVK